jgi:hypothetical protein
VSDYLHPDIPAGTRVHDVPLVRASRQSLKGFGEIVRDPKTHKIEIVTWPAKGWRKLDDNTGNEGGTTEGVFACEWQGNELVGRNEAVGGHYVLGFREPPETVRPGAALSRANRSEGRCCCGIATTIPMAGSSSGRSTASRSSCRPHRRATT